MVDFVGSGRWTVDGVICGMVTGGINSAWTAGAGATAANGQAFVAMDLLRCTDHTGQHKHRHYHAHKGSLTSESKFN